MAEVDTFNRFGVFGRGDRVGVLLLPPGAEFTRDEALILAAWLAVRADPIGDEFAAVLDAVRAT